MKRLLTAVGLMLIAVPLMAQNPVKGNLNAASTDCSTANSCATLTLPPNAGSAAIQLTGTFAGTELFEGTQTGVFSAVTCSAIATGTGATSAIAVGQWVCGVAGLTQIRVRQSVATSGLAQVSITASSSGGGGGSTGGGAVTIADGADVAIGTTTDNRSTATDATAATLIALLKQQNYLIVTPTGVQTKANSNSITPASDAIFSVTPTGYTTNVAWSSSFTVAVTNTALVTVGSGTRIVLHRAELLCGSDVSATVTAKLGFGAATIPTTGAGIIFDQPAMKASEFQGHIPGSAGWPNVIGVGADGEDLRFTLSVPTGGTCTINVQYSTEVV